MKCPIVISAFEGTYNTKYANMKSKYKYSFLSYNRETKIDGFVNELKRKLNKNDTNSVYVVPAYFDIQKELFDAGINFIDIYPNDNSCGPWQDRMDNLGYSEDDVANMIGSWKERVKDHTWRQLAKQTVIMEDDKFLDDNLI